MSLVHDIPEWLAWTSSRQFELVGNVYRQLMEKCFEKWLAVPSCQAIVPLFRAVSEANHGRYLRFLLSPHTYHWQLASRDKIGDNGDAGARREEIERSLVAEYFLAYHTYPPSITLTPAAYWTSLGDYCVIPATGEVIPHGQWHADVFLDGTSLRSAFDHDLDQHESLQYEQDALTGIYSLLKSALSCIGDSSPAAGYLVTRFGRCVVLHQSPCYSGFLSGSRSSFLGVIGLLNPHSATLYDLIDAFIHEGVHALLYTVELLESFYVDQQYKLAVTIKSPWSGRLLKLHSFVHACFVWYALAWYWSLHGDGSEEARMKLVRARRGFRECELTAPLRGFVRPDAIDAITRMQTQVRSA
jgi:hypothetical protein